MNWSKVIQGLRYNTRSLKTSLAIYFIPISVIPATLISLYATRLFEDSVRETLQRRADSERDAIISEIDKLEADLYREAKSFSTSNRLLSGVALENTSRVEEILDSVRTRVGVRVYSTAGKLVAERKPDESWNQIAYLSKEAKSYLLTHGETLERYPTEGGEGFTILMRMELKDKNRFYGFLEEQYRFTARDLQELKNRRQVDIAILGRNLAPLSATFAIPKSVLNKIALSSLEQIRDKPGPSLLELAGTRFAVYLYDLPALQGKKRDWAYLALFLSMTSLDASLTQLKVNTIYGTLFLILVSTLLIFLFSQRLVKPIEILVNAMKRVKTGRVEQIPPIDSTYEIEYLVRSFNEMIRNVGAAKRALEIKLEELHKANTEIKDTQSHLVQSAKLISLGELVAGVAHELNNPIAFIYSNMHHLLEYLEKIKRLILAYQSALGKLPPEVQGKITALEKEIELDYLLKDVEDLTRSCLDGADRTKEIVLGLRTFSRMDESSFQEADIHEGIRTTLRLLGAEFKNRISIHEEFGEIPLVECNLSQINQVFMNLLTNAAQAIDGRGEIWIRTRAENGRVFIEIEDTGRGIPASIIDKIFDPFFTTKKTGQGTGLGLSIAYGLVQKHQGEVSVKSAVGRGTRFTVELPVLQPATSGVRRA
ncbi:MAG: HAMP domain-containing protein [Deltaproteobacteria bacterium]|nr:HAMP domain-containing protein [Deltaproteobacteria bacterium]MBI3295645.1 HAMP domain-containing protein [Deltaproteobacteria bacterium]